MTFAVIVSSIFKGRHRRAQRMGLLGRDIICITHVKLYRKGIPADSLELSHHPYHHWGPLKCLPCQILSLLGSLLQPLLIQYHNDLYHIPDVLLLAHLFLYRHFFFQWVQWVVPQLSPLLHHLQLYLPDHWEGPDMEQPDLDNFFYYGLFDGNDHTYKYNYHTILSSKYLFWRILGPP